MNFLVSVSLTDDSAGALFQVARPPRRVQIMKRHKPVLHVHAGPHFEGAAHQHTHLTGADFCKQLFLPCLGIGLMDKSNLFSRNASCHQFLPDVIVDGELRFRRDVNLGFHRVKLRTVQISGNGFGRFRCWRAGFGCAQVAKHQLGQFVRLTFIPDAVDVIHAHVDLAGRIVRQIGIDDALVESQLSAVRGDTEHIVHAGIDCTGMDFGSALGQLLHHRLLNLCRLCHHIVIDSLRDRKVELVGCLDVGHFLEQGHQLRQIEELGKACSAAITGALRGQFNRRCGLTEGGSPAVKMRQPLFLESVMLKIAHHGVKLGHTVADGCACCKHHALAAGQLIDVTAFQQHIGGFLRIRCRESGHIAHLCIKEQ